MRSIITIDIGNTNITAGVFRGKRLIAKTKTPTHGKDLKVRFEKFFNTNLPEKDVLDGIIISSVVPMTLAKLKKILHGLVKCRISVIGKDIKVPIRNLYKAKSEVGQDRLVNAFAAKTIYGAPCVIIDFGTAVTFDIVSKSGSYLGGLILPGIEISLAGLYERTALLPKVELKPASYIIGKDTQDSIRGGILFGFGALCDGLVSKYKKLLETSLKVIATGGNARLIKKYAKSIQIIDENLTLKGLFLISL